MGLRAAALLLDTAGVLLAFLPLALVILAAAHLAAHLLSHAGSRLVAMVGLALTAGGALLLAVAPDRASYLTDMLPGFLLIGVGVGLSSWP